MLVTREPAVVAPCLEAIRYARASLVPSELVIVLATTDQATAALVAGTARGARVITAPPGLNVGLGPAQNLAFAAARGRRVVLLHEDSRPQPEALAQLVEVADAHPEAAVVGARLLDGCGELQQAGAVVWEDGRVSTIAGDPGARRVQRDEPFAVDANGMAGTLVDRSAWAVVGGFDERFFPAFYGDIDFCLAAWGHNRTVLCAPRAVIHHEREAMVNRRRGAAGSRELRAFLLERQRARFLEKWRDAIRAFERLERSEPDAEQLERALTRCAARAPGHSGIPALRALRTVTAGDPHRIDADVELRLLRAEVQLQHDFADHLLEQLPRDA